MKQTQYPITLNYQLNAVPSKQNDSSISLQQLVSTLVTNSLPAADRSNSIVVNNVGQGIALGKATQKAIPVIREILSTVVNNSRNGEIYITAEKFCDVVIVEVQERNNYNGYALAFSIGSIEPDAAKLGGHISIKGPQQKVATVSFSFPFAA